MNLGKDLKSRNEYKLAIQCFDAAIVSISTSDNAVVFLLCLSVINQLIHFSQDKSPEVQYYELRGSCHHLMKNFEMAVNDFHKAVQINPQNKNNRFSLKQSLLDSDLKASVEGENFVWDYKA